MPCMSNVLRDPRGLAGVPRPEILWARWAAIGSVVQALGTSAVQFGDRRLVAGSDVGGTLWIDQDCAVFSGVAADDSAESDALTSDIPQWVRDALDSRLMARTARWCWWWEGDRWQGQWQSVSDQAVAASTPMAWTRQQAAEQILGLTTPDPFQYDRDQTFALVHRCETRTVDVDRLKFALTGPFGDEAAQKAEIGFSLLAASGVAGEGPSGPVEGVGGVSETEAVAMVRQHIMATRLSPENYPPDALSSMRLEFGWRVVTPTSRDGDVLGHLNFFVSDSGRLIPSSELKGIPPEWTTVFADLCRNGDL